MSNLRETLKGIFSKYIFFEIFLLSIISGLPFSIMYTSIVLWLTESGVDIAIASTFGFARTPYAFKYLWAPIVDYIRLPILYQFLGRRRSWMVLTSITNLLILIYIANIEINENIKTIWALALLLGFSAATYDIAYDAMRIEKLEDNEQSLGAAIASFGYKVGAWISGAGVILMVGFIHSWHSAFYLLTSLFFLAILFIVSISGSKVANPARNFVEAIQNPILDIVKKDNIFLIIIFIITFKGGQAMLNFMCMQFYRTLGYSLVEIGIVVKSFGFFMSMIGIAIGGIFIRFFGIYKGVLYCGILQAVTDFSFIWLNYQEGALWALYVNIILENISGAMASCALVSFISVLCNKQFAGSHFAIFSSLAVVMNSTISGFAGSIVKSVGWDWFFFIDFSISIPPLFIIMYLTRKNKLS
jgi:PAT family beta-lactamase induction signal transducer AmpG